MNMYFSLALKEKDIETGLNRNEIIDMFDMLDSCYAFPIEIESENSIAMGFITPEMAEIMDYNYEDIEYFVRNILSDVNNESEDGTYIFNYNSYDFRIYISR